MLVNVLTERYMLTLFLVLIHIRCYSYSFHPFMSFWLLLKWSNFVNAWKVSTRVIPTSVCKNSNKKIFSSFFHKSTWSISLVVLRINYWCQIKSKSKARFTNKSAVRQCFEKNWTIIKVILCTCVTIARLVVFPYEGKCIGDIAYVR